MLKNKIYKLFYKDKNYSKIKELLQNSDESWSFNILGKIALYEEKPDLAYEYFEKATNMYGCAYTKFLNGDIDEARIILTLINNSSSAANWLLSLINIIYDNKKIEPTYFQIRNFYEQDLEMLFLYKQSELINEIIKRNNFFLQYNREIFKYTARVLHNNKYNEQAKIILRKSLEIHYKDPETHFLMGEILQDIGEIESAKASFLKALDVCPEYAPAKLKYNLLTN